MLDIALYSLLEFAIAFTPNLTVLLVLRALFGVAMGGECGASAPRCRWRRFTPQRRGFVSGLLQSGYPTGYLASPRWSSAAFSR